MFDEKEKLLVYIVAGVIVGLLFWWYVAGRNDVSDIGNRADTVREELTDAQGTQRQQAESLDRAETAAGESQSAIRDSARTADEIQSLEREDAELIRESQSILDRVRARGKAKN